MVVGLVVVNVMDCQGACRIAFWQPAHLTLPIVAYPCTLFERLCELMGVHGTGRFWQTAGRSTAFVRAIGARKHVDTDEAGPNGKLFAALFTDERAHARKLGSMVTGIRAKLASPIACLAELRNKCFAALFANQINLTVSECPVALSGAKHVALSSEVVRNAMDHLATRLTRFFPSAVGASTRAEARLASIDLVLLGIKSLAAPFANALKFARLGNAHAGTRAILPFGGGCCVKAFTADMAGVNYEVSSVRDSYRIPSGRRVRRPGSSVSDQLTLAHTKYTRSILQMQGANDE